MDAFILTWNPDGGGWSDDRYAAAVKGSLAGEPVHMTWSTGARRSGIASGDRAYLFRTTRQRGIVAAGVFTSPIFEDEHWNGSGKPAWYAELELHHVVAAEDRLAAEDLQDLVPGVPWGHLQSSGIRVPAACRDVLESRWRSHVGAACLMPDEQSDDDYAEGAVMRVVVNRFERDPRARAVCIARHGVVCVACGFDFEQRYGTLGREFIHVHHLEEIASKGGPHKVDPIRDMRPLCPNCHAMVHQRRPPIPPEELHGIIVDTMRATRQSRTRARGEAPGRSQSHGVVTDAPDICDVVVVPSRVSFPRLWEFALTYDGYGHHETDAGEIANAAASGWRKAGVLPEDLDTARCALFFEQRRWHHFGSSPDEPACRYLAGLLHRISQLSHGTVVDEHPVV